MGAERLTKLFLINNPISICIDLAEGMAGLKVWGLFASRWRWWRRKPGRWRRNVCNRGMVWLLHLHLLHVHQMCDLFLLFMKHALEAMLLLPVLHVLYISRHIHFCPLFGLRCSISL